MALTKYEEGSVRELCRVALPLMLSSLSVMTMFFVDRLLLAHYSTPAFNASIGTGTFGWAFIVAWISLVSIAEVFVAQHNGAGTNKKIGEPVWQMIWLSLSSILFFTPMAIWGAQYIYQSTNPLEISYFFWMMLFAPVFTIEAALATFFVGQGKMALITTVVILANILNVILDVIFIFGIPGYFPEMGIVGAAIATSMGGLFQCVILGWVFLNRQNRKEFGTNRFKLQFKLMRQCINIGLPGAFFVGIEMLGWSCYYILMGGLGEAYITVAGICHSVVVLLFFVAEGVSKAATTISGNLIGANRPHLISKVFISGCKLHLIFLGVMFVLFLFGSNIIMDQFLASSSSDLVAVVREPLYNALFLLVFYLFFEGLRMLLWGLLTATADTWFLLIAGTLSVWGLLVLPIYYMMKLQSSPIEMGTIICLVFSAIACLIFYVRFQNTKWKEIPQAF